MTKGTMSVPSLRVGERRGVTKPQGINQDSVRTLMCPENSGTVSTTWLSQVAARREGFVPIGIRLISILCGLDDAEAIEKSDPSA